MKFLADNWIIAALAAFVVVAVLYARAKQAAASPVAAASASPSTFNSGWFTYHKA
jgi:hypothetical protein